MAEIWMDVDVALSEVPVNIIALTDDTTFKDRETGIVYNQAGMDLVWNFITTAGVFSRTAVTPTTGGDYDWTHQGDGMYSIEIPASGGASINNDTEGFGWFTGICTGVLHWRGPVIGFRAAGINNLMIDSAYSATRGLAGTHLDAAISSRNAVTPPTVSQLNARTLVAADYFSATADTVTVGTNNDKTGYGLADDAITAAKFDELTAFPVKSNDSGTTQIARTGADSDTLENISDEIAALHNFNPASDGVIVTTNNDKTGYALSVTPPTAAQIQAEMEENGASILDTLQNRLTDARAQVLSDWINGGRLDEILDAIPTTPMRGTDGANTVVPLTPAETQSEVNDALVALHLDHLLAVNYDPASKPGVATALLNEMVQNDGGGVSQFTENALEHAPSGSGGDATAANQAIILAKLLAYIQLLMRSDSAIKTDKATELTEINANEGSGAGDYDNETDSNEATVDRGNVAWITGGGAGGSNAIGINIKDDSGNNVVECSVEIWDSGNSSFYERQTTDSSGNTEHNLDNGTYTVRIHKAGYIFSNETLVVSGAGSENYTGTAIVIGVPSAVNACRVYDYAFMPDGVTPVSSLTAIAKIVSLPEDSNNILHSGIEIDAIYDSTTGLFYWDIVKGAEVEFLADMIGVKKIKTVPDSETARLSDIT